MVAVRKQLDFFGVSILSVVTAIAGGLLRDLLIGATPASSIASPMSFYVGLTGGLSVFFFSSWVGDEVKPILLLDTLGFRSLPPLVLINRCITASARR